MARFLTLAAVVALVLVVLAIVAEDAWGGTVNVAEVTWVSDLLVDEAMGVAVYEWGARPCATRVGTHPVVPIASALGPMSGPEYVNDCAVLFNPGWLATLHERVASADRETRRLAYRDICHVAVHEAGHLLSYADEDPAPLQGVMTAAVWTLWLPVCTAWVNSKVPGATMVPTRPSEAKAPAKGKPGVTIKVRPCKTRACKRRRAAEARAFERRAAVCQKADLGLTAGRRPPKFCTK